MLKHNFIAPSINIEELDPAIEHGEIACDLVEAVSHDTVMTIALDLVAQMGQCSYQNIMDNRTR